MSKIRDLQIKDQESHLPATDVADEHAAFTKAANQNLRSKLLGTLLTYKKETGAPEGGRFRHGKDKIELKLGTRLVALMNEVRHGHIKWQGGQVADQAIHKMVDVPLLNRAILSDNDEDAWPVSEMSGKVEDPWAHIVYVPLVTLDGATFFTFSTKSFWGREAAYQLVDDYGQLGRQHPGQYPVIELGSRIEPSKKFGDIPAPTLRIVGWTGRPQLALADSTIDDGAPEDGAPDDGAPDDGAPPVEDITDFNDAVGDRVPF